MRNELTPGQVASYRKNGFLIIEDFLTPAELEEWREAVDEAVAAAVAARGGEVGRPPSPGLPKSQTDYLVKDKSAASDGYLVNTFRQVVNLWQDSARVRALVLDQRIGKMASELEGIESYRLWHDQALIKRPWDNATTFHIDCPHMAYSSHHALGLWVALDDATQQNGCMYFLPGTHKRTDFRMIEFTPNMNLVFDMYPEFAEIEPVPAPGPAGSCSFHNLLTVHGAGPNMTPCFRRAMTWSMIPAGTTFNGNQNILSDAQVAKLNVGDEFCDDSFNPVLYPAP